MILVANPNFDYVRCPYAPFSKGSNRDTIMFAMVNSDWRDKAKEALERIVEPDSDDKARAKSLAKAEAVAVAVATAGAKTELTAGPATAQELAAAAAASTTNGGDGGVVVPERRKDV